MKTLPCRIHQAKFFAPLPNPLSEAATFSGRKTNEASAWKPNEAVCIHLGVWAEWGHTSFNQFNSLHHGTHFTKLWTTCQIKLQTPSNHLELKCVPGLGSFCRFGMLYYLQTQLRKEDGDQGLTLKSHNQVQRMWISYLKLPICDSTLCLSYLHIPLSPFIFILSPTTLRSLVPHSARWAQQPKKPKVATIFPHPGFECVPQPLALQNLKMLLEQYPAENAL